jgi:hypothetical protein
VVRDIESPALARPHAPADRDEKPERLTTN